MGKLQRSERHELTALSYTLAVRGERTGNGVLKTSMLSDVVVGVTTVSTPITVARR